MASKRKAARPIWDRLQDWWWGSPPRAEHGDVTVFWGAGPSFVARIRERLGWMPELRWDWTLGIALALAGVAFGAVSVPAPSFAVARAAVWGAGSLLLAQSALSPLRNSGGRPAFRAAVFLVLVLLSAAATIAGLAWVTRAQAEFLSEHPQPISAAGPGGATASWVVGGLSGHSD
jgi:hypothetical protein